MGRGRGARSRIRAGERGTVRPARRRPATARRGSPWTWPQREVGRDTSRRGGGGSAIGSGRWRASGPDPRSTGARKGWDRRGKSRWAAAWNFHRSNGNCRWAGFGHPGVVVKRGPLRAGALRPVWYGGARRDVRAGRGAPRATRADGTAGVAPGGFGPAGRPVIRRRSAAAMVRSERKRRGGCQEGRAGGEVYAYAVPHRVRAESVHLHVCGERTPAAAARAARAAARLQVRGECRARDRAGPRHREAVSPGKRR